MIPTTKEQFECNLDHQSFFSIDADQTALILGILRNNIYTNPLLAAFKETVSNGLDEHVKFNISKPLDIKLPNYFSKQFSVRDYAKGLSVEFMTKYYTKVGYSTKSASNDLLGGLGLGRMSPLAYTDMYLVTSITDEVEGRVECEYVISKDNNKVFCSLLAKKPTTEQTGVKVAFEVKDKDTDLIRRYVTTNLEYVYDVPINIDGEPNNLQPILNRGNSFKIVSRNNIYGSLIGLIGGLPNKITLKDYEGYVDSSVYTYINRISLYSTLIFDVAIGQVDQSADKDIQLSEKTKKYIGQSLTHIYFEFKQFIADSIEKIDHWDEVERFLTENNLLMFPIKWKSNEIKSGNWTKHIISFKKTKKGNCVRSKDKYHYYNKNNNYYYNDLDFEPTTKVLLKYFTDLENVCLIDNDNSIDNSIYNFKVLSSIVPQAAKPVVKVKKTTTKVSVNAKCNKLSTYPGVLGRELNIDTSVSNYYISLSFYTSTVFGSYLKELLFKYTNHQDIYVVADTSLVKDVWIDLIEEINEKYKDLDKGFFEFKRCYTGRSITYIRNKEDFIKNNPNSNISKFLEIEARYLSFSNKHYELLCFLNNSNLLKIQESEVDISELIETIDNEYPLLESTLRYDRDKLMSTYIEQVDFFKANKQIQIV